MGIITKDKEGNFLYFTPWHKWQSCFVFTCGVGEKKAANIELCSNTINQIFASKSALKLVVCWSDLGADLCPWCYRHCWNFPLVVILGSVRIPPAQESLSYNATLK